jgi:hypothetical protein
VTKVITSALFIAAAGGLVDDSIPVVILFPEVDFDEEKFLAKVDANVKERPITSKTKILVEVAHIEATSKLASIVETAMYFATEPNPGQLSVTGKSLSTVFGTIV